MMTKEQIGELSRQFRIDSYSILREYLQLLFLKYFYELRGSENVYFRGGMAIHFLFGSFRFSEDLDFTSQLPSAGLKKLLEKTMQRLQNEISGLELVGRGVQQSSQTEIIKYHYGLKNPLTIRLEFSLREKPITRCSSPIETPFPITAYPLVVHLDREELLAEKVRALLARHKGRDLFDLWFLLSKETKIREDYIQKKMDWYKMEYEFSDLTLAVKKYREKALENDLWKFVPKHYRAFIGELKERTLEKLAALPGVQPGT